MNIQCYIYFHHHIDVDWAPSYSYHTNNKEAMKMEDKKQQDENAGVVFDGYVVDEHGEELAQFTGDFGF